MKRLPVLPTLLVIMAVVVMIGLGIWQLQRKAEKETLLARYQSARSLPPLALPPDPKRDDALLYRRATAPCATITDRRIEGGRNSAGESGWIHLAGCNGRVGRPAFRVVLGWSGKPEPFEGFVGGQVDGVIARDRDQGLRLILDRPPAGLQPAGAPSLEDVPNNHLFYAIQWFFFAAAAASIFTLALRKRAKDRSS
jgi:cytochrome oxidase assembly protein ShyY1